MMIIWKWSNYSIRVFAIELGWFQKFDTFKPSQSRAVDCDNDDLFEAQNHNLNDHTTEMNAFKVAMRKVRKKIMNVMAALSVNKI